MQQISSANALTWTINNLNFSDGGTASGRFDYNSSTNTYSNISIKISGPKYASPDYEHTFTDSDQKNVTSSSALDICASPCTFGGEFFRLTFASSLGNTVEQINFDNSSTYYGNNHNFSTVYAVAGGSVTAVPFDFNPTEGAALGIPLFIGLGMLRKKKLSQKLTAKKVAELVS